MARKRGKKNRLEDEMFSASEVEESTFVEDEETLEASEIVETLEDAVRKRLRPPPWTRLPRFQSEFWWLTVSDRRSTYRLASEPFASGRGRPRWSPPRT